MKEIKALIRPNQFGAVLDALHEYPNLPGVTVSEVRGFGRKEGRSGRREGARVRYGTSKMFKLECVINDEDVDQVIELIQQAAHTGNVGDGKIFVFDIDLAVKIRTGARLEQLE